MSVNEPAVLPSAGDRSATLTHLRNLLREKHPVCDLKPSGVLPTGVLAIDESEGGLRRGAVTELVGSLGGGGLFVEAMLAVLQREKAFGALLDAASSFDPQGAESPALTRLLWVRCANVLHAVKAADLLIRDGNLPLVLLDLRMSSRRELGRVSASTWHRFQRLIEPTSIAFVVLTEQPLVEGARVRIAVRQRWSLTAMKQQRRALLTELHAEVFARRAFALPGEGERQTA